MPIEVRITGRGRTRDDLVEPDKTMVAHCDVCSEDVDLVVLFEHVYACKDCIRLRLDATSVAAWQLRESDGDRGLPWGKVSG